MITLSKNLLFMSSESRDTNIILGDKTTIFRTTPSSLGLLLSFDTYSLLNV